MGVVPATSVSRSSAVRDVRVLERKDVPAAAEVLAAAFMVEPGNVALFPDPAARHRMIERTAEVVLERSLTCAGAFGAEVEGELAAVAIWDPPGARPRVPRHAVPAVLQRVGLLARNVPTAVSRMRPHLDELVPLVRARNHAVRAARRGPSWHLAFLATHPAHQGRGLARALLDHVLRRCDEDGLAVWLETTDPSNPPIYERFGFATVAHVEPAAWLPGLWVMRREPRPTRRSDEVGS